MTDIAWEREQERLVKENLLKEFCTWLDLKSFHEKGLFRIHINDRAIREFLNENENQR
jgi:hypothetical protein